MRIVNRQVRETADLSAARDSAWSELLQLLLFAVLACLVLYVIIGWSTDFVVSRIPYETEARLFGKLPVASLTDPDDAEKLDRPSEILRKLVESIEVPPLPYHLLLVDTDEVNAFAFPGGAIGVTSGLLDAMDEDISQAFVLGHELGHFKHRDHLRGFGRVLGAGVVFALLFHGEVGTEALQRTLLLSLDRGYSRQQEDAADQFGVEAVMAAYGVTEGIERLFEIIETEDNQPDWAYMFATHPAPGERINQLRKVALELAGTP